jgi:hypothetical protein
MQAALVPGEPFQLKCESQWYTLEILYPVTSGTIMASAVVHSFQTRSDPEYQVDDEADGDIIQKHTVVQLR